MKVWKLPFFAASIAVVFAAGCQQVPQELVNAVSWHHDPENCDKYCLLSDVVHVANIVGRRVGFGKGRSGQPFEPSLEVIERLDLNQSLIDKLAEQTVREVGKLTDILD